MVAVIKGAEVSDAALEVMQSYYDQLGNLEPKIPFNQAKIYFKWLDAFDKGGWLGGAVSFSTLQLFPRNLQLPRIWARRMVCVERPSFSS